MMSSKIDRITSNVELFEHLSTLGTNQEAHKFLQSKEVSVIGDLSEPDQHRYFTIKDAPEGVRWQDVNISSAEPPTQSPDQPKILTKKPVRPVATKQPTGWIPDGAYINPEIQRALIRFYPESAQWVKVDGIMGMNTRGALNRYKAEHHDDRLIDDPQFQEDLIRRSYTAGPLRSSLPKSFSALEKEIEQFEAIATRL